MPRLPAGMKKRLQASIENLSPRETAKLLLIYGHESDKKNVKQGGDYPPSRELRDAILARLAKSRGKPGEKTAVDVHNAALFAEYLLDEINRDDFVSLVFASKSDAAQVAGRLRLFLYQDAAAQMIRQIRGILTDAMPKPVSTEDFARLQSWAKTRPVNLWEAAELFAFERGEEEEDGDDGDDGDDDQDGEEEYQESEEAQHAFDALVAKLEAGELVGGEALDHWELGTPVAIEGGALPAWAALRVLWSQYLAGLGYRKSDHGVFVDWSPLPVNRIVDIEGKRLEGDSLKKTALAFYRICRRRPWGKGLVAKPDPDVLVKLLTAEANPFLHIDPVDFGRIDWEIFRKSEKNLSPYRHDTRPFESSPFATWETIQPVVDEMMGRKTVILNDYFLESFYPTESLTLRRWELSHAIRMMESLDTTRQPFTFGYREKEEGELSLSELLGVDFLTPLEMTANDLQYQLHFAASMREALRVISDRYFDGLPVLYARSESLVASYEAILKEAADNLAMWVDRIRESPWNVDTTSLELADPEPEEEVVNRIVEMVVGSAKTRSRVADADAIFGVRKGES